MSEELKPCPCGSSAHIEDQSKTKNKHEGVVFGRIVCDKNNPFDVPSKRCYMKTVCGPLKEVIRSWNNRPREDALKVRIAELEGKNGSI